jgi:hypothetical protein
MEKETTECLENNTKETTLTNEIVWNVVAGSYFLFDAEKAHSNMKFF